MKYYIFSIIGFFLIGLGNASHSIEYPFGQIMFGKYLNLDSCSNFNVEEGVGHLDSRGPSPTLTRTPVNTPEMSQIRALPEEAIGQNDEVLSIENPVVLAPQNTLLSRIIPE